MKVEKIISTKLGINPKTKPSKPEEPKKIDGRGDFPAEIYPPLYYLSQTTEDAKQKSEEFYKRILEKRPDIEDKILQFDKFKDDKGELSKEFQLRANRFLVDNNLGFYDFIFSYEKCIKDDGSFNERLFNTAIHLYKNREEVEKTISPEKMISFFSTYRKIHKIPISEQIQLLSEASAMRAELGNEINLKGIKISLTAIVNRIISSIQGSSPYMEVSEDDVEDFRANIISANSPCDEKLINSLDKIKTMKDGIPLKFSRNEFIEEINALNDPEAYDRLWVRPVIKDGETVGYDGFISFEELKENEPLYDICNRYFYQNEVQTGDSELDEVLNKIIKGCPEYLNIQGKIQHGLQAYPLDIHSLVVYINAISDAEFKNLEDKDKEILKTACLFHDISKKERKNDKDHPLTSAISAYGLVKRYIDNQNMKDRVISLIKNHEWLGNYENSKDKESSAKKTACNLRWANDFELSKIMTKADMRGVNEEFYEILKGALSFENLKPIEDNIKYLNSTGCAVFSDFPMDISDKKELTKTYNNREFQVINFNEIKNSEDMGKYGFETGKKKEDIRLLVHMTPNEKLQKELNTLKLLTNAISGGILSESLVNPTGVKNTYHQRRFGVLLFQSNSNTISLNNEDQKSGFKKEGDDFPRLMFDKHRDKFKDSLRESLGGNFTDEEYGEFYKKSIVNKRTLSNFTDDKEYVIGSETYNGGEIKKAILEFQNKLIDPKSSAHNEIIGYSPEIKGVIGIAKDIKELPDELLDFAYENKLPVILI